MAEIFTPSMDPGANTATRSYLSELQKTVNKLQAAATAATARADALKAEETFEKAYLDQANKELTTAKAYHKDAEEAFTKIQALEEFLKARLAQADLAYTVAHDSALEMFTAAASMNDCAQVSEASFNMARAWNTSVTNDPQGNEVPYTQAAFMDAFTEIDTQAKAAFSAVIKASEAAFKALADAQKTKSMAKYLYTGVKQAYAKIKTIYAQADSLYAATVHKQDIAQKAYDQISEQAATAANDAEQATFQLDMYEAELTAAVKGAAGVGSSTPPGS